ncbi:hypothetical protein [Streptomyces oryzae]|nr:hypothetical protein [Streptomyces oryzae]
MHDLPLESLCETIGDSLRWAGPAATGQEMVDACKTAQTWA